MAKKRFKGELCAYCGEQPAETWDHVIPKALFAKPLPPGLVKVPTCQHCNNEKSKNDDYLRDLLVLDPACENHPAANMLQRSTVLRSVGSNHSQVVREALRKGALRPLYLPSGIYVGDYYTADLPTERVNSMFSTMVRGLYYSRFKQRIPTHYDFGLVRYFPVHGSSVARDMLAAGCNGPYDLGGNIVTCIFGYGKEDAFSTLWLFTFYGGYFLAVATQPRGSEGLAGAGLPFAGVAS